MRKNPFRSQNFILVLSLVAGMAAGGGSAWLKPLILPMLALVMTISSMGVGNDAFRSPRAMVVPVLAGVLMNFLVLGGALLVLGNWLIADQEIRAGFILLAIVPPAVAVIPFSVMLNGNLNFTMLATIGAYLCSLVLTPVLAIVFLGEFHSTPETSDHSVPADPDSAGRFSSAAAGSVRPRVKPLSRRYHQLDLFFRNLHSGRA